MSENTQDKELIKEVTQSEYKYGFVSDIEADEIPVGLNEETVRLISKKKVNPNGFLNSDSTLLRSGKTWNSPTGDTSTFLQSTTRA